MEREKRYVVVLSDETFFILSSYDYQAVKSMWGEIPIMAFFKNQKDARKYVEKSIKSITKPTHSKIL